MHVKQKPLLSRLRFEAAAQQKEAEALRPQVEMDKPRKSGRMYKIGRLG